MKLPRNVSQILAALLAAMASGCSERSVSALDGVTDLLSAEIRRVDGQLLELRAQLTGLPDISPNLQTGHLGYHGKPFTPQGDRPASLPDTRSIRLDLGSAQSIDAVVLVAVDYTAGN